MTSDQLAYFSDYDLVDKHPFSRPWSRGDFSFATNGHAMVRVRKIVGIPERDDAPDCDKVLRKLDLTGCVRPMPALPPLRFSVEEAEPGSVATIFVLWRETASFQGAFFDLRYLHLVASLPGLLCGRPAGRKDAMPFAFEGGIGALMPCGLMLKLHHDLDRTPA